MVILDFPAFRQAFNYDCGAIVLESVLAYYGLAVSEEYLLKQAKTTRKGGTPVKGIVDTARSYGLKCISKKMNLEEVKSYLQQGIPVILVLQAWSKKSSVDWEKDWADGHYVVAIGYTARRIYFEDPSSLKRTYLTVDELNKRWHDVSAKGKKYFNHGIAIFGKKPSFHHRAVEHMG